MSEDALAWLEQQEWPGNVRELENAVERAAVLSRKEILEAGEFRSEAPRAAETAPADGASLSEVVAAAERQAIASALRAANGNRREAAQQLGVSLRTLFYKIDRYGIT